MLQQTTIAAVVPYFERFVERFPSLVELAEASENEVLRYWEGLGYYRRAQNIYKTARLIITTCGGRFPDDASLLRKLPGIGRYTAGAIASFAFDQRAPIVEANTLRLYSRLLGYRCDPRSTQGQRLLWTFAERILPRAAPGPFNQALMQLGGSVCRPLEPECSRCPVRTCCRAFADAIQDQIPLPTVRPEIVSVTEAAVAVRRNGTFLLRRRGDGERWASLWDFERFPLVENVVPVPNSEKSARLNAAKFEACQIPAKTRRFLESKIEAETGIEVAISKLLTEIRHGVTRFRIRLFCFLADYRSGKLSDRTELRWVKPVDFREYPMSVTSRKLARLLNDP